MNCFLFNDSLTMRFNTLERNIKSKSNSFYDSYLDLLEATIKYMMDENSIYYDPTRTCGFIVKTEEAISFFKGSINIDDSTFNKLPDYIKKCNDHKHKKEKNLQIEGVINFLTIYFSLVNCYLKYFNKETIEFNADYFISIYGETERLNSEYKAEVNKLTSELKESYEANKLSQEDLQKYKCLISHKDMDIKDLDEQNKNLQQQISVLKDIKLNSLEEKMNKTIDMLNNMQNYLVENRIIARKISMLIDGRDITDEELRTEREKMISKHE